MELLTTLKHCNIKIKKPKKEKTENGRYQKNKMSSTRILSDKGTIDNVRETS